MLPTEYPQTHFLGVPAEIRDEVYRFLLHPDANRIEHEDEYTSYDYAPTLRLFRVCRSIYREARAIFRQLNVFIRIETPWPEAQQHVALEGHVPIIVSSDRAKAFRDHSMLIAIDAPQHVSMEWDTQCFIILADDLHKFTDMWYYSDLTHPSLNEHLRLELTLRNPYASEGEEEHMTAALQRKLLLPFGAVKNLNATFLAGNVQPVAAIEREMRALQSEPHKTPEHCLREATRLKFEGNAELGRGSYQAALRLYNDAWRAIHVVVRGRQRHIHADAFFRRELHEEPFAGMNGQAERLVLRVQLVANTCHALLKMGDFDQCRFWGMRSINMLREGMGVNARHLLQPEQEAFLPFPAANQMGKIYYRTAVACKELGDESEARRLLRVARVYLPHDENIKRELAATALKIG